MWYNKHMIRKTHEHYDWDAYIAEGVRALPPRFRERIRNVAILLEDVPNRTVRCRERLGRNETLLGLYQGVPLPLRGEGYGVGETLPDTITLYRLPIIEEAGDDPVRVREVVIETMWHEFGHHFGLDDDELYRREALRSEKG